jgi:hypothetical protein
VERQRVHADPDANFHVDAELPIRIDGKIMPILMQILLQVLPMFYTFSPNIATLQFFIFLISVKCVLCFHYFGQHIEKWEKIQFINFFICLELIQVRTGRLRIAMSWMPIPIGTLQNDAYPTRSGSTTLLS